MYILTIVCSLLIWYGFNYYKRWKNIYRYVEKLTGPKSYPIVGSMYPFLGVPKAKIMEVYLKLMDSQPPLFRIWNGNRPEINISAPEHMEIILKSPALTHKGGPYNLFVPWLGEGLFTSNGAKWDLRRKLVASTFHFRILENYMKIFVEKSKLLLEILDTKPNGLYFDISSTISNCTLDIICEAAIGVTVNAMSTMQNEYVRSVDDLDELITWKFLKPYINWDPLFYLTPQGRNFRNALRIVHNFSNRVIADRKKLFYEKRDHSKTVNNDDVFGKKQRLSFLDLLLNESEDKKLLSDTDLRNEVNAYIFAGYDTVATALNWCLFLLRNYPEVQEKVYEEIKSILQDNSTPNTLSELNNLKYLECVIKESLRLYPSVIIIGRTITEELEIDGYKIPKGVQANLHIYVCHRNPRHFPDPEKFDPDRFLPENSVTRHPYAFVPFSAGPRNCLGQKFAMYEEKTILASIIKKYKIISQERREDIKLLAGVILRSQSGINLKLEQRF